MKKAVIQTGSHQYVVSEGETINVELLKEAGKTVTFEPLLVMDGDTTQVGTPTVSSAKVTADIVDADVQSDKVTAIRLDLGFPLNAPPGQNNGSPVLYGAVSTRY